MDTDEHGSSVSVSGYRCSSVAPIDHRTYVSQLPFMPSKRLRRVTACHATHVLVHNASDFQTAILVSFRKKL